MSDTRNQSQLPVLLRGRVACQSLHIFQQSNILGKGFFASPGPHTFEGPPIETRPWKSNVHQLKRQYLPHHASLSPVILCWCIGVACKRRPTSTSAYVLGMRQHPLYRWLGAGFSRGTISRRGAPHGSHSTNGVAMLCGYRGFATPVSAPVMLSSC
jgi:hypothetical protein